MPPKSRSTTRGQALSLVTAGLLALLVAGCGGAEAASDTPATTGSAGIAPPTLAPGSVPPPGSGPPTRAEVEALGYEFGSSDAPIHVIELSDFGCGYCKKFHDETFPTILAEYVETGKVHWRFIPFDVGMFPNAQGALKAGVCAGEQTEGRHEAWRLLFNRQRDWKRTGDVTEDLQDIVRSGGINLTAWTECFESGRRNADAQAHTNMARRLGVRGTPTFFIDGYPVSGALPLDTFRQIFESVLAERANADA